jgi:hypothetical protein
VSDPRYSVGVVGCANTRLAPMVDVFAEIFAELALCESGRRESNPRSQLGKLMFCR